MPTRPTCSRAAARTQSRSLATEAGPPSWPDSIAKLLLFIVPLCLDTFAVSAALGLSQPSPRQRLRISLLLSSFETVMPVIGVLAGRALGGVFGTVANYLGIGLVALVGLWMLFGPEEGERSRADGLSSGRGLSAVALGLSVSLDELAMGFSIGLLRLPVVLAVIIIGAQAFLAAQIGLRLGARGGERLREGAERGAGLALLALGALLLVQQLTR